MSTATVPRDRFVFNEEAAVRTRKAWRLLTTVCDIPYIDVAHGVTAVMLREVKRDRQARIRATIYSKDAPAVASP